MSDDTLRGQLELLDRLRWFLHDDNFGGYQRILGFSDNVVVGEPIRPQDLLLQLGMMIESVAAYQLNMTARGRFLRGGLSRGPLFMDARYVTGEGLITAYKLETHAANVPRVVVAPEVAALILANLAESPSEHRWPWQNSLLIDEDDCMFISYLPVVADDEIPGDIERGLDAHRRAVESEYDKNATSEHIRLKYRWVAKYHNHICRTVFSDHLRYLIDRGDLLRSSFRTLGEHLGDNP